MSSLDARIAALGMPWRRLLKMRLEQQHSPAPLSEPFSLLAPKDFAALSVRLNDVEDAYPLTMMQAGMIFHMDDLPGYPLYHGVGSYERKGGFDQRLLQKAVDLAVQRHPNLRTGIDLSSFSEPLQLVYRSGKLSVRFEDIRHLSPDEQDRYAMEFAAREKRHRFDLSRPPLLRLFVHVRSEESFQLTVTEFHPLMDGWSLTSTLVEVLNSYFAMLRGTKLPVQRPLRVTYRDYVKLEREALQSGLSRDFWKGMLDGAAYAELPRWPKRCLGGTRPVAVRRVGIDRQLVDGLKNRAGSWGIPVKTLMLAAHMKVLGSLTNHEKPISGLVQDGRPECEDGDQLRGLCVNNVPFSVPLLPATWHDLVEQVFNAEKALLAHRRYPLTAIQRDTGMPSLFETFFNFTRFHVLTKTDEGARPMVARTSGISLEETNYTLSTTFSFTADGQHLDLLLEYATSTLASEQIERIAGYYERALRAIAFEPFSRHDQTTLLSSAEFDEQFTRTNYTGEPKAAERVHDAISRWATENPNAIAVEDSSQHLTYGELHALSNKLANRLRDSGICPEDRVGVAVDRSADLIVAFLGILKAGAAYVPVDPAYPDDRVNYVLKDARARILIVDEAWGDRPVPPLTEPLRLGPGSKWLEDASAADVPSVGGPRNLAYLIYTSGSTGWPKGVEIEHRNLTSLLAAMRPLWALTARDTMLTVASPSFDMSIADFCLPLVSGARLLIARREDVLDGRALVCSLESSGATVLETTPTVWRLLIESGWNPPKGFKAITGGEALSRELAEQLLARNVELWNFYGPTETTVWSSTRRVTEVEWAVAPIGRPIENTQMYVLDEHQAPLPIGVSGELYIAGMGIARGYWGQPAKTAERFLPDPYGPPGTRCYRTGDRVRYEPNGDIDYLGRSDNQVKLRGFRIELGEIEAVLERQVGVRQAVVAVRQDTSGNSRLVAYFTRSSDFAETNLRDALRRSLPDYMVPSMFVAVDQLTLTPNGKVDRRALPEPAEPTGRANLDQPPRTSLESDLARIWSAVLGQERIGIHDNLFELGGDSITSMRIAARARAAGIPLHPRDLFQHPTIAGLAEILKGRVEEDTAATETHADLVDPETRRRLAETMGSFDDAYPLTPLQQGLLFHAVEQSGRGSYVQQFCCRLVGDLRPALLRGAWRDVVIRHDVLRTRFAWRELSEPMQLVSRRIDVPWEEQDLRSLPAEELEPHLQNILTGERERGFDITRAPLLRIVLIQITDSQFVLVCTYHHLLLDGWSMPLLFDDLIRAYSALRRGETWAPEPPPQFRGYVAWLQRRHLTDAEAYWRRTLAGYRTPIPLNMGQKAKRIVGRYDERSIWLSEEDTRQLEDRAARNRLTLNTLSLGAWSILLRHYGGLDDVVFGTTVSSRPADLPGADRMLGVFINTLPFRVRVVKGQSIREWLAELQQRHAELRVYDYSPLVQVQGWSEVPRGTALFETFLNFQRSLPRMDVSETGVEIKHHPQMQVDSTNYAMTLLVTHGQRLEIQLKYDSERFRPGVIGQMLEELRDTFLNLAANMDEAISVVLSRLETLSRRRRMLQRQQHGRTYRCLG